MLQRRAIARTRLRKAPRTSYFDIVNEVKLTPEEERIINERFLNHTSITQLAYQENCSEKRIKEIIAEVYDRVYDLLYS